MRPELRKAVFLALASFGGFGGPSFRPNYSIAHPFESPVFDVKVYAMAEALIRELLADNCEESSYLESSLTAFDWE
jgi:hypothetical protein